MVTDRGPGAELSDGKIINATQQETNEKGATRFSLVLPDGETMTSEWFTQKSAKLLMNWCAAVRSTVDQRAAAREQEKQNAKRNAALMESRADLDAGSPDDLRVPAPTEPPGGPASGSEQAQAQMQHAREAAPHVHDPADYVQEQLHRAIDLVDRLEFERRHVEIALEEARLKHAQWERAATAIGVIEEGEYE